MPLLEANERTRAEQRLYESLVREARALRLARQVGYRNQAFDRLQQAKALGSPNVSRADLRREAAACLGDFVGLDPFEITGLAGEVRTVAFHPSEPLAAIASESQQGTNVISLREMKSWREIASLSTPGRVSSLTFTFNGKQLLAVVGLREPGKVEPASLRAALEAALQKSALCAWTRDDRGNWVTGAVKPVPGAYACYATTNGAVLLGLVDLGRGEHSLQELETGERWLAF